MLASRCDLSIAIFSQFMEEKMMKTLKRQRSPRVKQVSLAIAGLFSLSALIHVPAYAQSSEGSIFGKAAAGAQVVVKLLW